MASLYQKNITQNVQVAAPDIRPAMQAELAKGESTKFIFDTAGQVVKQVIAGDIISSKEETQRIQEEALRTNMAANKAQSLINQAEGQRTEILNELARNEEKAGGFVDDAEVAAAGQRIGELKDAVDRLQDAAKGGMSFEQYTDRVSTLAKKYISRYPGYADEVRKVIGAASGLEGADLWAQQQFVKLWTNKKEGTNVLSADKLLLKDIEAMHSHGFGTHSELMALYTNNPSEFQRRARNTQSMIGIEAQNKAVQSQINMQRNVSDDEAKSMKAAFTLVQSTSFAGSAYKEILDEQSTLGKTLLDLATGAIDINNADRVNTAVQIHTSKVNQHINTSEYIAKQELRAWKARNPNVSSEMIKEMERDIEEQSKSYRSLYASKDGMLAIADAISKHRDKGIAEIQKQLDLNTKIISGLQNVPMVQQYFRGGADRQRLQLEAPDFFNLMERLSGGVFGAFTQMSGALDTSSVQISILNNARNDAREGSTAGQSTKVPTNTPKETTKAAMQIIDGEAWDALNKRLGGKEVGKLDPTDLNLIRTSISNSLEHGASAKQTQDRYKTIASRIEYVNESDVAILRSHVDQQTASTFNKRLLADKAAIEAKYGVKLEFGVNDAGQIAIVAPNIPRPLEGTGSPSEYNIKVKNENDARQEFWNRNAALTSNMVFLRAGVMAQDPKVIATEYASLLNTNSPFKSFYSLKAKPVAEQAAVRKTDVEAMSPKISPVTPTDVNKPLTPTEVVVGGATPITSTQKANEQTTPKTSTPNTSNASSRTSTSEKWWR